MRLLLDRESDLWREVKSSDLRQHIRKAISTTLNHAPKTKAFTKTRRQNMQISVLLTDDAHIQELNRVYRKKDKPTNVLSFTNPDLFSKDSPKVVSEHLGDIVIAFETLEREANEQKKHFLEHLTHMCVHSTLHLLGYDHEDDTEANRMEKLEIKVLKELSIANPYLSRV